MPTTIITGSTSGIGLEVAKNLAKKNHDLVLVSRDLTKLEQKPEGDADEDIEVLKITPKKLNEIIASGEESLDGKTITAWFRACQILNKK